MKYKLVSWLVIAAGVVVVVTGVLGWTGALRLNSVVGVRTDWSLSSPEHWESAQTHAGPLVVAAGAVYVAAGAWNLRLGRADTPLGRRWWTLLGGLVLGTAVLLITTFVR